ncbi:zf-HC2 domain-containing protein [Actinomadura barringtoniae]|uniref:Zf-HC2 domain-containing protein n=1 Tax=Actinomadura barringtoniae TaxID=1427535 RepID=A0A939TBK9_9ACTN|nr:zf-HC2 domain-containing protein [Actinomadura barringtoniae]MBO2450295.1 zf-HC2 domain-containing protein [Actinomadura barringtoniae]
MSSQIEHTDVGAYALGLLEEDDKRAFEAHLQNCPACRAELGGMAGLANALSGVGSIADEIMGLDGNGPPAPGAHPASGAVPPPATVQFSGTAPTTGAVPAPDAGPPGAVPPPRTDAGSASAPPPGVIDLLERRRRAERRHRRGTYLIGSVAAAALLATGLTVGSAIGGGDGGTGGDHNHTPAQALVIWGERHNGSDAKTGASGLVGLESKGWGTHVGLELRGVHGPLKCKLEAVSKTGVRDTVTTWAVPNKGYGVPGQPNPLIVHGGTAIPRQDLARFEVRIDNGGTDGGQLLSIPL